VPPRRGRPAAVRIPPRPAAAGSTSVRHRSGTALSRPRAARVRPARARPDHGRHGAGPTLDVRPGPRPATAPDTALRRGSTARRPASEPGEHAADPHRTRRLRPRVPALHRQRAGRARRVPRPGARLPRRRQPLPPQGHLVRRRRVLAADADGARCGQCVRGRRRTDRPPRPDSLDRAERRCPPMMQEWGGPLIGALLVGALIFGGAFLGMRHLRYDGPQARAEEDKRNTRLRWFADRVRAQMFRYEMGGRPEWGVMPTSASDGFGVGRRTEWNTAIRFQYRNHDVQAIDYTYWIHRRTRNRTRSIEYNKVFYEVRTPPWPLVQVSSRYIHTFSGPGDQFPEITLGNEFDRWFRVHAEDERF